MKSCMKKMLGGMSLTCILAMSSCNDDGQTTFVNETLPENIPVSVYEDFQKSFPEATSVSWSVSDGYAIVTFTAAETRSAAGKTSVWYEQKDAKKKMQCRTVSFEALPEAVRTAFASSEYAAWTPEETAHLLTRYATGTVETICILRARETSDGTASKEVTLCYTAEGVLVKLTLEVVYDESYRNLDEDYRDWLPQTPPDYVTSFVNSNYPQASYLYIYAGKNITKVKILDGRQARLLLFDAAGNWLSTHTELHANELPETVLAAFRSSSYAGYRIDHAEECLTADEGHYYLLTVKDEEGNKQEIRIHEDGTLEGEDNEDTPAVPGEDESEDNNGDNGTDNDEGDNNEPDNDNRNDENEDDNNGSASDDACLSKTEIDAFLQQRYLGATVTDRDYEEKGLEVELAYNGAKIKVQFVRHAQGYVWTSSEWDLDYRQPSVVPAPIQETIAHLYAEYQLYFLKYIETATEANYYEAGLKSAQLRLDIKVKMDAQGNVLAEYGKR